MKSQYSLLTGLIMLLLTQSAFSYPGESIVRDANGDYIITYWNGANLMRSMFYPSTKIEPKVKSNLHLSAANLIAYRFTVFNGGSAKQPITSIMIRNVTRIYGSKLMPPISSITTPEAAIAAVQGMGDSLSIPNKWNGAADADPLNSAALQADWFYFTSDQPDDPKIGVMPGSEVRDFGFLSLDLPGIGSMQLEGEVKNHGVYKDEGPDPEESAIVSQLDQIEQNDFVTRNIAAPLIAIPLPFNAAILLDSIRAHVATWPGKQLLDPAFAAQLDRYMVAAAESYRHNQPKDAKEHIKTLRKMLDHEHKILDHDDEDDEDTPEHKAATRNTIDRLAARVLDFDLRYVLKRMEKESEQRTEKGKERR